MSLFRFNDNKSRKQINHAINYRNDTKMQNARGLLAYHTKRLKLADGRGEWELAESIVS